MIKETCISLIFIINQSQVLSNQYCFVT